MKNPYLYADKAIKLLNRKAVKRFLEAERKLSILGFDELNVIHVCREMYTNLQNDNLEAYESVGRRAYMDAGEETLDYLIFRMWLEEEVLKKPNPVTNYIYQNEVDRKRDRLIEAVNSQGIRLGLGEPGSPGGPSQKKALEFRRALRYWADMTAQYADIVTDEAMLKSYRDQGIQYVRWRTEEDERVCEVCRPRDGKIYPIEKAPPKAHWRCRCWYEPVTKPET